MAVGYWATCDIHFPNEFRIPLSVIETEDPFLCSLKFPLKSVLNYLSSHGQMAYTFRKSEQAARGDRRSFVDSGTREKRIVTTAVHRKYAADSSEHQESRARRPRAPAPVGHSEGTNGR